MQAFSCLSPVKTGKVMYMEEEVKSSSIHALSSCWSGCDRIVGTVKPLALPAGAVAGSSSDQHGMLTSTCGGSEASTSGIGNFGEVSDSDHTNIAGILYKWVNFGKGWRPRWFILNNGVLSYYKVHGPNKIIFNDTKHQNSRIIGEESQKLIKKQRSAHQLCKAYGEVHLQVSSIHKSSSDSRKFYIFTGTKTLHLRAESKEDRSTWLDALISTKNKFKRTCPIEVAVSPFQLGMNTEKLRERLLLEGMPEHVIADCEAIVKMEFDLLLKHLRALEENHLNLLERLKQLEGEKLELETTVIDERQSKGSADDVPGLHGQGESEAETDDDMEVQTGVEADSDEDDGAFFDADEFSGSEFFCTPTSLSRQESERSLEAFSDSNMTIPDPPNVCMEKIGFDYPHVERRKSLPEPKEKEKTVSLWSMIKDNIGKDLTKICLPVYFNEPISSLQKCFEDLEYSYLLDRAYAWGKQGDHLMQILNVAAFAVSGYSSTKGRTCKPFNPLLGETYEADFPDKGLRFISEKVSHHPMVMACHCEGKGWVFWGDSNLKSKFWGRSIQLDPVGTLTLQFADGRRFQWSKVTTSIYNLIIGKLYVDHYGTMRIHGNGELLCKLKFKEQSVIERNPHQVQGYVYDKLGNKLATLFGKWDEAMYYVQGDLALKSKDFDSVSEAALLWRCNDPPEFPTRCNLTSFAITLNEITVGLKEKLPPTDSRLRPDQRHLENGEYELANLEKLRLEQKQRQARKLQERGWQPRWFRKSNDAESYEYTGGYWEAREKSDWTGCPDIFGIDMKEFNL